MPPSRLLTRSSNQMSFADIVQHLDPFSSVSQCLAARTKSSLGLEKSLRATSAEASLSAAASAVKWLEFAILRTLMK